jgi:general stress protein 26
VEDLVCNPEQIVPGDMGVIVAQTKNRNGLLRSPFIDISGDRKVLTVYWTSKIERYWKEEKNENKI